MDTATPPDSARLTFRDATESDVPALVTLIESAYRGDSSRAGWTTEADILQGQRTDEQGVREVLDAPAGGSSRSSAAANSSPAASSNTGAKRPTSECSRCGRDSRAADSAS